MDLSKMKLVALGEPVGVVAAQSIGEPGTQLSLNTVKAGGAAEHAMDVGFIQAEHGGHVELTDEKKSNLNLIESTDGNVRVGSRSTMITIVDAETSKVLEMHSLPYGASLRVKHGEQVDVGQELASWNPHAHPIINRDKGIVRHDANNTGTIKVVEDPLTGMAKTLVKGTDVGDLPMLKVLNAKGEELVSYLLPEDTNVLIGDGKKVRDGDVLAEIPRKVNRDVSVKGGLQRLTDFFEARVPEARAVYAKHDGKFLQKLNRRGHTELLVVDSDNNVKQRTTIRGHVAPLVVPGDRVSRGDMLVSGASDLTDVLELEGLGGLATYFLDVTQSIYRMQGAKVDDKHIELILRQMTRSVWVDDAGDTGLESGTEVHRHEFLEANRGTSNGNKEAEGKLLIKGITKAALKTESFISAMSFRELPKVLFNAAFEGLTDPLMGIKENLIMNRQIPAGTGWRKNDG